MLVLIVLRIVAIVSQVVKVVIVHSAMTISAILMGRSVQQANAHHKLRVLQKVVDILMVTQGTVLIPFYMELLANHFVTRVMLFQAYHLALIQANQMYLQLLNAQVVQRDFSKPKATLMQQSARHVILVKRTKTKPLQVAKCAVLANMDQIRLVAV